MSEADLFCPLVDRHAEGSETRKNKSKNLRDSSLHTRAENLNASESATRSLRVRPAGPPARAPVSAGEGSLSRGPQGRPETSASVRRGGGPSPIPSPLAAALLQRSSSAPLGVAETGPDRTKTGLC